MSSCLCLCVYVSFLRSEQPARERRALLALWWCTNGPRWVNAEGWEEAAAQEDGEKEQLGGDWWFGVGHATDGDGVTLVDLRRNGLQGWFRPTPLCLSSASTTTAVSQEAGREEL